MFGEVEGGSAVADDEWGAMDGGVGAEGAAVDWFGGIGGIGCGGGE